MSKKKNNKKSEIVFALIRFPDCFEDIEQAYKDKEEFLKTKKKLESLFNTLSGKDADELRGIILTTSKYCSELKQLDVNFLEIACSSQRFSTKRSKCLNIAKKNVSDDDFIKGKNLLARCEILSLPCEKFGLTHNKLCVMIRNVNKTKDVVKNKLELLSKCSDNPKKHFRDLCKGLDY